MFVPPWTGLGSAGRQAPLVLRGGHIPCFDPRSRSSRGEAGRVDDSTTPCLPVGGASPYARAITKRIPVLLVFGAATLNLTADEKFLQLSLTPDIALQSRDSVINGSSLNIWGENRQSAFALGFVNGSTGDSCGLSWGIVNYAENYTGVELGFVNYASGDFKGLQLGAVNIATRASGLQRGCVNYTETLQGVQIGFINIAENNLWFDDFPDRLATIFPIVN